MKFLSDNTLWIIPWMFFASDAMKDFEKAF